MLESNDAKFAPQRSGILTFEESQFWKSLKLTSRKFYS
jgi:hypothetical protein